MAGISPQQLTGSVQVKKDTYYIALNTYVGGKRKPTWVPTGLSSHSHTNQALVEGMLERILATYNTTGRLDLDEVQSLDKKRIMFVKYMRKWIAQQESTNRWETTTWESYETHVRLHIIPYFEPLKLHLDEVKPKHIKSYLNDKATSGRRDGKPGGLSTESVAKHASVLRMAFADAMIDEDLESNPVDPVTVPKGDDTYKKEPKFLTAKQANNLLAAADGSVMKAMIYIALYYGLRRSELVGLKWSAIDMEKNTLEIRYTVTRVRRVVEKERTKNRASKAKFALLDDVKAVLELILIETEEYRRAFGDSFVESDFVFVKPDGKRYHPDAVTRMFKTLLKRQHLPDMDLHDLRHSCASVLYEKGWDMKRIQEWMRHSSSSMTAYYTHLSKQFRTIMADDMSNTFTYTNEISSRVATSASVLEAMMSGNEEEVIPVQSMTNVYYRDKLYREVWERPVIRVAEEYGVSAKMIGKICAKMAIPVPPNGYWSKLRAGEPMEKPPLPPYDGVRFLRGRRTSPAPLPPSNSYEGPSVEQRV